MSCESSRLRGIVVVVQSGTELPLKKRKQAAVQLISSGRLRNRAFWLEGLIGNSDSQNIKTRGCIYLGT